MGLFFNDEKAENGYTLFSNNGTSYLIDNCGFKINTWESEYKSSNGLFITEEGDLLRMGQVPGSAMIGGEGGIIEKYSWDGALEWSYRIADDEFVVHHDMLMMSNGNMLVTVWQKISSQEALQNGRTYEGGFYNEQIWELQPLPNNQANIVWRWSALDHVIQDVDAAKSNFGNIGAHPELINLNYITEELEPNHDWLHINSIDYNQELDQIAVCSRNNSEIYIIDHSTSILEARSSSGGIYGKGGDILYRYGNPESYDHGSQVDRTLHQGHDVSWINTGDYQGHFLIFNNKYIDNTRSQIQIWNNPSDDGEYQFTEELLFGEEEILWTYDDVGFYSSRMSSAQMMSNGNILTTEGTSGEISEITPSKEKVWKYINPVNRNGGPGIQSGTPQFNSLFKSVRYRDDYTGFQNRNLMPGEPVELSPDDIGCQIFLPTTVDEKQLQSKDIFTVDNQRLMWKVEAPSPQKIYILDVFGRIHKKAEIDHSNREVDISSINRGLYFIYCRSVGSFGFYNM
ncbi:MAG: hypothetical protein ACJA1A_002363 [Saprospiraceae bacterium]|jgi:hypothetical protein